MAPRTTIDDPYEDIDPEKREFYRSQSRAMPISAKRLLGLLPGRFNISSETKGDMSNEILLVAPSTELPGLFEIIEITAGITGEYASATLCFSIVPRSLFVALGVASSDDEAMIDLGSDFADLQDTSINSQKARRAFEKRVSKVAITAMSRLGEARGKQLQQDTVETRRAVDRYLSDLRPSRDLSDTLKQLKSRANREQIERSQKLLKGGTGICTFGLDEDRTIWDIAWLCQVLHSEFAFERYQGCVSERVYQPTPEDIEAYRRVWILASRLAGEIGWPKPDPLVPERSEEHADESPWPDQPPQSVPDLCAQFLASRTQRCSCGKELQYVSYQTKETDDDCVIVIRCRCANGHEQTVELG